MTKPQAEHLSLIYNVNTSRATIKIVLVHAFPEDIINVKNVHFPVPELIAQPQWYIINPDIGDSRCHRCINLVKSAWRTEFSDCFLIKHIQEAFLHASAEEPSGAAHSRTTTRGHTTYRQLGARHSELRKRQHRSVLRRR